MNINEQGLRRRIGSDYLIGSYAIDADGTTYFTDIRGGEGDLVKNPIDESQALTVSYTGAPLEEGEFYSFKWHLDEHTNKILIDGEASKIDNAEFVQGLFNARLKLNGSNLELFNNFQKTIFNEVTGAQHTYIYELLQNANDYPYKGEPVNVKFILTEHYLFFLHSGACFNLRNVVGISSINQGEKTNNTDTIGYKGIGFKTVFVNNEYVYLHSGAWSLRFDRRYSESEFSGECPWALMPIPTPLQEMDEEVKGVLRQNDMRVQFALRHKSDARQNLAQLDKVFSDSQILLFIPHVYRVDVVVDGATRYTVEKDDKKWVVSNFRYQVPQDLKQWVNENVNSGEKIPEKFKNIHNVRISFAVSRDGDKIVPIENALVYNYLPTELRLGFNFLINADFVPNASRSGLHDVEWNNRIMEQCGCQFADWWVSLMQNEGEFDLTTVFDILPDFSNRDKYAQLFIKGLKKRLIEIPCVPTVKGGIYRLVKLSDTLNDQVKLVASETPILTDEEFYRFTKLSACLPHPHIRCHSKMILMLNTFQNNVNFRPTGLDVLPLMPEFKQWLSVKENNIKFNSFLLSSGYIQNMWERSIFLMADGTLGRAVSMYYDIDKFIDDISFLSSDLARIDPEVRDALNRDGLNLLTYQSKFKRFEDFRFTQSIFNAFDAYKSLFEDKSNSVRFIHFLAVTNYIQDIPGNYPLFLDDDRMVYGKQDVYIKNEVGMELASHSWIDKAWIGFLHEDYFANDKENVSSYLNSKCHIKELTNNDCYKLFIANDSRVPSISIQIQTTMEANVDFYHYLLTISDEISNFTNQMRQKYTILTTDGKEDAFTPVTRTIFWQDEDWEQMAKVEWMPENCCLALQHVYSEGLSEEEIAGLRNLLSTKQIVQKFSIPGLYNTLRTRLADVFALITTKELSKDFLNFLFLNRQSIFKAGTTIDPQYRNVPILTKGNGEMTTIALANNRIYLPDADMLTLYNMPWFDKSTLILCDDYYSDLFDGSERCEFFRDFGLKIFDKKHYLQAHLFQHLNEIRDALCVRENNLSFHRYIADCHNDFGENDLKVVKSVPIYIESPEDEKGVLVKNSWGHYLPSKQLSDIISRDIIPISILRTIHPDYIKSENDKKYFIDKLKNAEIDDNFLKYIVREDNAYLVAEYIREKERNIRFWRWACDYNGSREAKAQLRIFPMLSCGIDSEEISFAFPSDLFASSFYTHTAGLEQFIAQFVDSPEFVSPEFKEEDDQRNWESFLKALKVTFDFKDIVFRDLLPKLKGYKDVTIIPILAQHVDSFKNLLDKGDEKTKEQLSKLQILCADGTYRTPENVIFSGRYFDIKDDPFPEIEIGNLISEKYLEDCGSDDSKRREITKFITIIADWFHSEECPIRFENATQFCYYKIGFFVNHQDLYMGKEAHFSIVARLADCMNADYNGTLTALNNGLHCLVLKTMNGQYKTANKLYLSSRYNPYCDFMRYGITEYDYVSEEYLNYNEVSKLEYLFYMLGIRQRFSQSDLALLRHERFAIYFWTDYAVKHESDVRAFCNYETLRNIPCIPTVSGVQKPHDLYDYRQEDLCKIVKRLEHGEEKIPSINLPNWLGRDGIGLRNNLYLLDCLEYLKLNTPDFRRKVLEWVINTPEETLNRYRSDISNYISSADWYNGAKKWSPLSGLVALEWGNETLKDNFGANAFVCHPSYMPETRTDFDKLCNIFHIKVLTNKDFVKRKGGNFHYDEEAVQEFAKRLLYLAYKSGKSNWQELYNGYFTKLKAADICSCEQIVYSYNENIQNILCIYDEEETKLWYQGKWDGFMFQGIIDWIEKKIGIVGSFDKNYLYRLFSTPFNQYIKKNEAGTLPEEVLELLNETDRAGIEVDEYAHSEEFNEIINENGTVPEEIKKRADEVRLDRQPLTISQPDMDEPTPKQERNNHVPHSYPEHRATPTRTPSSEERPMRPMISRPEPLKEEPVVGKESPLEERLQNKWDQQLQHTLRRPMSSSSASSLENEIIESHRPVNAPTGESFFSQTSHALPQPMIPMNRTGQNLKRKNTEAQNSARAAADQEGIYDLLNRTPKYTFKWFKYLMELQFTDRGKIGRRTEKIDFKEYQRQEREDMVRLLYPSANVPVWLENADIAEVIFMSNEMLKSKAAVVKVDDYGVDVIVDKNVVSKLNKVSKIRLLAESSSNIIDSLCDRFIQLGYDDDYNLEQNLPHKIEFIYGPPGTGKTTRLVERLRQIVGGNKKGINVLILTPTNKAADVIATKLVEDDECGEYTCRFGSTESAYLMSYDDVLYTRDTMDMGIFNNNIVVTTAARYSYDCVQPNDVALCDFGWDYIIIDEASMIDLITMTYILHKGKKAQFIIAGDPKQIQPVSQGDIEIENIYKMVGLDSFKDAIEHFDRYQVEALTTQHRSIPAIGDLVSQFAYNGLVVNDLSRSPQKPLQIEGMAVKSINFIGFKIEDFDRMYGLTSIKDSAFQLYSALFTYNMVGYMVNEITKRYSNSHYTIGIVCPYKAEADAIQQLLDNRSLDTEVCSVYSGTVHKFQGDECDIMFIVMNPPANITQGSHINNENIINVAMSRARDYVFFVMPERRDDKFEVKNRIGRLVRDEDRSIMHCSELEELMFHNPNYLYENTNVTCHLPVNVYYEALAKYEVRIDDTTLDIQINDTINTLK